MPPQHRRIIPYHFLLPACLLASLYCSSQDSLAKKKTPFFRNVSVGTKFYAGSYLVTKSKAEYIRDSYATYGEIFFQHGTDGSKDWHIDNKLPQWGFSFLYGNTGSRQYIGHMSALYAFINVPLRRARRYTASFRFGTGPGWVSRPFDIYTNPKNVLIGTKLNAFINIELQNEIKLSSHWYLDGGLGFMHLSNGGTTLPNLGLNTPFLSVGLRYAFKEPFEQRKPPPEPFAKRTEYKIYTTMGVKQAPWIGGNYYAINVLQAEIARKVTRTRSFGGGLMLFYNRTLQHFPLENPATEKRKHNKVQAGVYGSYELFFGRLSLPLQVAAYIYNKEKSPLIYQQFGLRYKIMRHISAELLLKSHTGQADFIHTGIGYQF
ncbi:MAG TPA: acyloxyacyl hydrolase [Chitinophagaceae bacterium]|nr:acyloxyacyl hydrolase [Chitinophagaceae bacterium]